MESVRTMALGICTFALGSLVGFFAPAAASAVAGSPMAGAIAASVVGTALVACGVRLTLLSRGVAFWWGVVPTAAVSTAMIVLIAYAGGLD